MFVDYVNAIQETKNIWKDFSRNYEERQAKFKGYGPIEMEFNGEEFGITRNIGLEEKNQICEEVLFCMGLVIDDYDYWIARYDNRSRNCRIVFKRKVINLNDNKV